MAVDTKIGLIVGNTDTFTVRISVFDTTGAQIAAATAISTALANRPTITGYTPEDKMQWRERADHAHEFDVTYNSEEAEDTKPPAPIPTNGKVRRVSWAARAVVRSTFLASVGVYGPSSTTVTSDYPHLKWKIDATEPASHYQKAHNHIFEPLSETQHIDYYPENATVDDTLLDAIEALKGKFNDDTFLGHPAGSVQFVRFEAIERNRDDWQFIYGFGYVAEKTSFSVANDIAVPTLRACDYVWVKDEPYYDSSSKILQARAKIAVVGRWGELGDFDALGIP